MFYEIMVWAIFSLIVVAILLLILLHWLQYKRIATLNKINEAVDKLHETFENHFNTTDKTILDLRKERDFWKKEATKNK